MPLKRGRKTGIIAVNFQNWPFSPWNGKRQHGGHVASHIRPMGDVSSRGRTFSVSTLRQCAAATLDPHNCQSLQKLLLCFFLEIYVTPSLPTRQWRWYQLKSQCLLLSLWIFKKCMLIYWKIIPLSSPTRDAGVFIQTPFLYEDISIFSIRRRGCAAWRLTTSIQWARQLLSSVAPAVLSSS